MRDFASRQALELSDDRRDYDVERLVGFVREREPPPARARHSGPRLLRAGVAAAVLAAAGALVYFGARRVIFQRSFEACVRWHAPDAVGGAGRVEAGARDVTVVGADGYPSVSRAGGGGLPFVVTLAESGKEVGAVFVIAALAAEPPR